MPTTTTTDTTTTDTTTPTDTTADRATTARDKLWAALHAHPGATADQLAQDAGIGRSTAGKILARWVADATVDRTTGPAQGTRPASRFAIAPTVPASTPSAPTSTGPSDHGTPNSPDHGPDTDPDHGPDTDPDHGPDTDPDREPDREPHGDPDGGATSTDGGVAPPPQADRSPADADTTSAPAMATDPDPLAQVGSGPRVPGPKTRLAPGALHGLVEDYLRDHPDHGPTQIGHDLGRSSGAIANALERLVTSGAAVRSSERPKRYRLATDDAAASGPET